MTDAYTKAVLTAIAVALFALVGQNANQASLADPAATVQRMVLCDLEKHCSKLISRDGSANADYYLPTIALQPGP